MEAKKEWNIEYDNDDRGSFIEWWEVYDTTVTRYRCSDESEANFLCDRLNRYEKMRSALESKNDEIRYLLNIVKNQLPNIAKWPAVLKIEESIASEALNDKK